MSPEGGHSRLRLPRGERLAAGSVPLPVGVTNGSVAESANATNWVLPCSSVDRLGRLGRILAASRRMRSCLAVSGFAVGGCDSRATRMKARSACPCSNSCRFRGGMQSPQPGSERSRITGRSESNSTKPLLPSIARAPVRPGSIPSISMAHRMIALRSTGV